MAYGPPSLNNYVDWFDAVQLCGVTPEHTFLPCTVQCPLNCNGQLTILSDHNAGGAWAYCRTCNFAGDMIHLAAKYWNDLDVLEATLKLGKLGFPIPESCLYPDILRMYAKYHVEIYAKMSEFWHDSQKRLMNDITTYRGLQLKLGINLTLDRDRWLSGPGLLYGGSSAKDADHLFRYGTKEERKESCVEVLFHGVGWKDVLVLPLSDLPGRVKGYVFVGRECRDPLDLQCKHIALSAQFYYTRTKKPIRIDRDPGIALYEARWNVKDQLFVMSDPVLALQLQCKHLQDNSNLLPVVSLVDFRHKSSTRIWNTIPEKKIYWGKPTPLLFTHAKATNSRVCLTGFEGEKYDKKLLQIPLKEWLDRVNDEARPWDEVLEKVITTIPYNKAESILSQMELNKEELKDLLKLCPDEVRVSMQSCVDGAPSKVIIVERTELHETNNKWACYKTGEIICNGKLLLDKLIHFKDASKNYYEGRIVFQEQEHKFSEYVDKISEGSFEWMRKFLLEQQAGLLVFNPKWQRFCLVIAEKFHPPKIEKGFDKLGWDKDELSFVFPNYIIRNTGEIQTRSIDIDKATIPTKLTEADIQQLTDNAKYLWFVTNYNAHNHLCAIFNSPPLVVKLEKLNTAENTTLDKVMQLFIQYVIKDKLMLPDVRIDGVQASLFIRVNKWLANWFESEGGNPDVVTSSSKA